MQLQQLSVTVLGGGVAGLAVAQALARRGAEVTLLEQSPEIAEVGAGLQISPNGAVVLRALGLGAALDAAAVPGQAVVLRDGPSGRQVSRLDLASRAQGAGFHLLHRADLVGLLAEGARAAGVRIRLLQQITGIAHVPGGCLLRSAQGGEWRCDLLLGADGLHSKTRALLNGAAAPFFTGQVAWRALIPGDSDMGEAQVFMGPGRHLVSYPLRGGRLRNIVAVEARRAWVAEGWAQEDRPENLRRAFAGFAGPVPGWLEQVEQVHLWGLFRHPVARRWHGGHAAVLGDAAHPTLPFMAQGANMALEDAWVLAAMLAREPDLQTALAAYQAARRDRVCRVIAAANRNAHAYHLRAPLRQIGHAVLRLAGLAAPDAALKRFDWIYRHDVTRDWP